MTSQGAVVKGEGRGLSHQGRSPLILGDPKPLDCEIHPLNG